LCKSPSPVSFNAIQSHTLLIYTCAIEYQVWVWREEYWNIVQVSLVESFYNRQRLRAKLGYLSPVVYAQKYYAGLVLAE
jgi:hypothetical protein